MNKVVRIGKKEIPKPPYVKLEVSTWSKDSHALYDYEAENNNKFSNETFFIQKNCKIYRHMTSMRTYLQYEGDLKELALENIYIASVFIDSPNQVYRIQSADTSGIIPHPIIRQDHPDLFRNSYLVIRDFQKIPGVLGFPLQVGHYVKLGRIEYLIIELKNSIETKTLKQTTLQLNKGVHKVNNELKGTCRICLCDQSPEHDPLINPCNCKGSCELIHTACLKNWINSKVKRDLTGIAITYNFSKFQCQICKSLFPKVIQFSTGEHVEMITFQKPAKPYIVLESVSDNDKKEERNLHVICSDEKYPVKIGRGHQCQIRVTDISVSRTHAEIRYEDDKFLLKDLQSKFGTLIKFREEIEIEERIRLQYGRTCFDFNLNCEEKTEKELIEEEIASRPMFYTRAQLREMGELHSDEENDQY